MAEQLHPEGRTLTIEGVSITAPGLSGAVSVHYAGGAGLRGADQATSELLTALQGAGVWEQLTIEIADPVEAPAAPTLTTRSTSRGDPAIELELPGPGTGLGQVLLASDEDGILSWHLPDDIAPGEQVARGEDRRRYTIRRQVVADPEGGARGLIGAIGKKILKVLVFDLVDRVAGEVSDFFVRRWETANRPHRLRGIEPGTFASASAPDLDEAGLARLVEGRALLFVHGTASRCNSAFGRLPDAVIERLSSHYGGRVAGFDHPTIGFSPTENATWFAGRLADLGAALDVDIVAHSRGGLVARVLAEQQGAAGVMSGGLRVGTIVFVATPNAGTALADFDRLGRLVDNLTNLLELIPDNPITDPLEVILSVVKQLAVGAFKGLDGLASMTPGGSYLGEFLNVASATDTTYRAIASDFEPAANAALARLARDMATDAIFREQANDLVVPTVGVYTKNGSSRFPIDEPLVLGAGESIDHSSFWVHPSVHDAFERWLPGST